MSVLNNLKRFCRSFFTLGGGGGDEQNLGNESGTGGEEVNEQMYFGTEGEEENEERCFGTEGGTGDEDENEQRYFHNPLLEPVPSWRALPMLAQCEVLQHLDLVSVNNLRRVARYEKFLVEERFGFHAVIGSKFVPPEEKLMYDSMVNGIIDGMAGKLIRGLELLNMPPPGVPGETARDLVQRLISFPGILFDLKLTYVDFGLIHAFLKECGNVRSLQYQTSLCCPIPTGAISEILHRSTHSVARIPAVGETLIQQIPAQTLHLPNLTSLTLELRQASTRLKSDWANPLYILLAVTPPNLKKFQFWLDLSDFWMDSPVTVLIHSMIADFLSKVRGSLRNFEFASASTLDSRIAIVGDGLYRSEATPVLSQLLRRFGSRELRNVYQAVEVEDWSQLWTRSERFMKQIARELRCLEEVEIISSVWNLEMRHFRGFLKKLPAMTSLSLTDDYVGFEPETYDLFMFPRTPPFGISSWATLQKLSIVRTNGVFPRFALEQFLEAIPNLRELELFQQRTGRETFRQNNFSRAVVKAGRVVVNSRVQSIQLPDVTICVKPPVDKGAFQRLRVLKLQGFHVFANDVRNLRICRNLEKLHLEIPPCLDHSFFGVESADLLHLMAKLKKLSYVKVSQVYFPWGRNNRVARRQRNSLQRIGTLEEKCFCLE